MRNIVHQLGAMQLATNYLMSKPLFRSVLVAGRHIPWTIPDLISITQTESSQVLFEHTAVWQPIGIRPLVKDCK